MTNPHDIDPTGAYGVRPDAGTRTDLPSTPVSEHRDGGLLAVGTSVQVTIDTGDSEWPITGTIVDFATVPAPYLSIQHGSGARTVVFVGPGVIVQTAPPAHPALG